MLAFMKRVFAFLRDWFGNRHESKPSVTSYQIPTPVLPAHESIGRNRHERRSKRHFKHHNGHLLKKKDGHWCHDGHWRNPNREQKALRRIRAHP